MKELTTFSIKNHYVYLTTDTDDERILQSDWMKRRTGFTQSKEVVSHTTFPR